MGNISKEVKLVHIVIEIHPKMSLRTRGLKYNSHFLPERSPTQSLCSKTMVSMALPVL